MTPQHPDTPDYECLDPEVGALLECREPLSPPEQALLAAHLDVCEHCKILKVMDGLLSERTLSAGARPAGRHPWLRVLALAATLSAAAALLALLSLRPSAEARFGERSERLERGGESLAFREPFEGEVLRPGGGALRWTPLAGAAHYALSVSRSGGEEVLAVTSLSETRLGLPDLPRGEYIAELRALPDHLAGSGPVRVAFRSASWGEFLGYRLRHASNAALALLAAALAFGGLALSRRLR